MTALRTSSGSPPTVDSPKTSDAVKAPDAVMRRAGSFPSTTTIAILGLRTVRTRLNSASAKPAASTPAGAACGPKTRYMPLV
jgi:hypothetical protein